jgi:ubiquinone biosynthesis protein COQ9
MSEAMRERQELRDRVGEAALGHAAFDGWGRRTLHRAAEDAGVDRGTAARLFPQGAESLLDWLADWADRQMEQAIDPEELAKLPVRRRIARLVRARLEALTPHREAVRRAAIARSIDALAGGRELWRTVDRVWQAVGLPDGADRGVGFYSRRATLAGVLTATFLYWLEDSSADCADSWAFLDRRIEDVMRLGRVTSRVSDVVGRMPGMRSSTRPDAARP